MKICVLGLGYVGTVTAACFAQEGYEVAGVDPNPNKIDLINRGQSPIIEKNLAEIIAAAVKRGRLRATTYSAEAILGSDMSHVCVGTPSQANGGLDLSYVRKVCDELGSALREHSSFHVVVIRSTMLPGSVNEVIIPTLERLSGKKAGVDFGVCSNPEFLREGSAIYDFYNPPKTVIGESDRRSGDLVSALYATLDAPLVRTNVETAQMVKYVDNAWHALKVGFANEIGNICKTLTIDSHAVMDIFCQDTKLNLSSAYMKPGFAFGGSCLPKDLRALTYKGRTLDLELPILNAILPSNQRQIERGLKRILDQGNKKIGILGCSFKAGTDDLRESPMVELIERLLGKGYDVRVYDRNVKIASLIGANRDYILNYIPHISQLMVDTLDELLTHAETVVVGNNDTEFRRILDRMDDNQVLVDLVRITPQESQAGRYDGICW